MTTVWHYQREALIAPGFGEVWQAVAHRADPNTALHVRIHHRELTARTQLRQGQISADPILPAAQSAAEALQYPGQSPTAPAEVISGMGNW